MEWAYGEVDNAALARMEDLRKRHEQTKSTQRLPGTRLVREWRGVRHEVIHTSLGLAIRTKRHRIILRRFCGEIIGVINGNIGLRLEQ